MGFFQKIKDFFKKIFGRKSWSDDTGPVEDILPPSPPASTIPNWFMYHGGYEHGGYRSDPGGISLSTFDNNGFGLLKSIMVEGSILSVPAVVDGYIYVGLANSYAARGANGGTFYKINLNTGIPEYTYTWNLGLAPGGLPEVGDSHGFTGMGCTPSVVNGKVYFTGFNGKLYCLDASNLSEQWVVDLRFKDAAHNQPVTNIEGVYVDAPNESPPRKIYDPNTSLPPPAGWSSPLVIRFEDDQGNTSTKVYLGMGEGENKHLYSFIYCLDGDTGNVEWIFCNCKFDLLRHNRVNELPEEVLLDNPNLTGFTVHRGPVVAKGCSTWAAIAYDEENGLLYASTGNPEPDMPLPSIGYSCGVLALNALTGEFVEFTQMPASTSYRVTDADVDIGSSVTIFDRQGKKAVGVGCKNGGFMVLDAKTMEVLAKTKLLPHYKNGKQIEEIDPHPPKSEQNAIRPQVSNAVSNTHFNENYFGPFNTAAIHPGSKTLFIGIGGPNYHMAGPGIDSKSTPFMKAINWDTLEDAWPMDDSFDPPRYANVTKPAASETSDPTGMYTSPGESGLSSPAVVNDVVFCSTSKIALYAFNALTGELLWNHDIGSQTLGFNGGYGFCMGPAIYGDKVIAGSLVLGQSGGGILQIFGPNPPANPVVIKKNANGWGQ